jgi:hypothetical protein
MCHDGRVLVVRGMLPPRQKSPRRMKPQIMKKMGMTRVVILLWRERCEKTNSAKIGTRL